MKTDLATRPIAATPTRVVIFPPDKPGDKPTEALVRYGRDGTVKMFSATVSLAGPSYSWPLSRKVGDQWKTVRSITALGYDRLNRLAGISFICPESVLGDDARPRPNPYMHRNARGETEYVRVRMIGLGRNATGSLVAQDLTVNYDLQLYFCQDLYAKWRGRKNSTPKEWGRLRGGGQAAPGAKFAPYEMPGGLTLWVDLSHADVIAIVGEHINRQRFAERNAITICRRNILKRFFAVTDLDQSLSVPVIGWSSIDRDVVDLSAAAAAANSGRIQAEAVIDVGGESMRVEADSVTVSDPDEVDASLGGDDEIDGPIAGDSDGANDSENPDGSAVEIDPALEQIAALRTKIGEAYRELGPDDGERILGAVGVEGIDEVNRCGDAAILEAGFEALQRERLRRKSEGTKPRDRKNW